MAHNRTSFRNILTRRLAVMALLCMYGFSFVGASALLLGASSTSAVARGGFHHGGFRGAAFAARAWGLVGVWAFIRTATADTIPTTATPAFAMRFGSAS